MASPAVQCAHSSGALKSAVAVSPISCQVARTWRSCTGSALLKGSTGSLTTCKHFTQLKVSSPHRQLIDLSPSLHVAEVAQFRTVQSTV